MQKLQIFEVSINGQKDIEWFTTLTREQQINWVLKHSNQKNEEMINNLLDNLEVTKQEGCVGCGQMNNIIENPLKNGDNISERVSEEVTVDNEVVGVAGNDSGTDTKRRNNNKKSKGATTS